MKITKIERDGDIFTVTLIPNIIDKLLMRREKVIKYKDIGKTYLSGGASVYVNKDGKQLPQSDVVSTKIEAWKNRF